MGGHRLVEIFAFAAFASATIAATGQSRSGSTVDDPARPSGSVLCAYLLTVEAAEAGRECRPGQHPEMLAELQRSESRLEAHIIANSHITRDDLERYKLRRRSERPRNSCESLGPIYDGFAAYGTERFRGDLDWMLASRPSLEEGGCL